MTVITRFAPSPTGFLHIGGARTALFNWLFARHHGGKYLLRIEDTDKKRSTPEAVDAINEGLSWLGLEGDGETFYQSARAERHAEVARELLAKGRAYYCYCSPEELQEMREKARAEGRSMAYDGRWRDRDPSEAPEGVDPVIRLKSPIDGETVINDLVQGEVRVKNDQLDDMILLRADGSPTYMHSVVVDDHDMGITHVIRGDDHLNNAFRQKSLYQAMDWDAPEFAHIPLIHGPDGAKLSKRHGALGVDAYRDMGYLPEAVRNYLLRLGWSHGDDEIISNDQAVEWFDLDAVGRSPSRFDFAKLESVNAHYIRESKNEILASLVADVLKDDPGVDLSEQAVTRLSQGMDGLKQRAKNIKELADLSRFYISKLPLTFIPKAEKALTDDARAILARLITVLEQMNDWSEQQVEEKIGSFIEENDLKLGQVAQPLRAALTGSNSSPGIFEVMAVLGRTETLNRVQAVCDARP